MAERNNRKVARLIEILLIKTEEDFKSFCDILIDNNMGHLVSNFLSDHGKSSILVHSLLSLSIKIIWQEFKIYL